MGRTEQFRPGPDLMAYIGRPLLVNQGDVPLMEHRYAGLAPIALDSILASKARYLASCAGISLSEYLNSLLRPVIEREWKEAARRLEEGGGE